MVFIAAGDLTIANMPAEVRLRIDMMPKYFFVSTGQNFATVTIYE